MRAAVRHVRQFVERRQRGAARMCGLWVAAAVALSLCGCANIAIGPPVTPGQGAPPGPTLPTVHGPLGPDGAYNYDNELCRNFRAYHRDCRRRHSADDSGDQQQGSSQGNHGGADQPGSATSSA